MKNLLFIILFIGFHAIGAQKLSDYKYLLVPQNFKDFQDNQFELNSALVKKLKAKGYEVIQNENGILPEELKQDPCQAAVVNLVKSGNIFKTKLTFEAKDCNNKVLFSQQGASDEKDFEMGYNEALQNILKSIPNSLPLFKTSDVKVIFVEKTEPVVVKPLEKIEPSSIVEQKAEEKTSINNSQNYMNGNVNLKKILLGNNRFILVSANSSIPYATFTESTKEGVYRVVLENGLMTLGYLENGNYVIEITNKDGSFRKVIFEKN
ncbi:MAG: hypothetical protein H7195_08965 [Chryseobacterium sp.]|nr:hypothetical protein [Chryseobacterium sp.]